MTSLLEKMCIKIHVTLDYINIVIFWLYSILAFSADIRQLFSLIYYVAQSHAADQDRESAVMEMIIKRTV